MGPEIYMSEPKIKLEEGIYLGSNKTIQKKQSHAYFRKCNAWKEN